MFKAKVCDILNEMTCVTVTTKLIHCEKRLYSVSRNDYKLDMWHEMQKRWMILGVLISMALAVLSPKVGAPGGPLHSEYLSTVPLWFVYYNAGRRAWQPSCASAWAAILGSVHAHVVAPVLAGVTAASLPSVNPTLMHGVLLSSAGGPCVWLSLSTVSDTRAALLSLAVNFTTSLIAAPAALFFICGRAPTAALGPTILSTICAIPPLCAGALHERVKRSSSNGERSQRYLERIAALALLYVDCCERISQVGAGLYVGDVLTTLALAVWSVSANAALCVAYGRRVGRRTARTLALCAVPKALHAGWETSIACVPAGISRLAGVFIAPAQALLLASMADCDDSAFDNIDDQMDDETLLIVQ